MKAHARFAIPRVCIVPLACSASAANPQRTAEEVKSELKLCFDHAEHPPLLLKGRTRNDGELIGRPHDILVVATRRFLVGVTLRSEGVVQPSTVSRYGMERGIHPRPPVGTSLPLGETLARWSGAVPDSVQGASASEAAPE